MEKARITPALCRDAAFVGRNATPKSEKQNHDLAPAFRGYLSLWECFVIVE